MTKRKPPTYRPCVLCGREYQVVTRRKFCPDCCPPGFAVVTCPTCGERYSAPIGNRRRYCSDACRDANRIRAVEVCGHCHAVFVPANRGQKFCSISCGQKGRPKPSTPCRECGEPFVAQGNRAELCLACRREVQRYHRRWVPDAVRQFVYERDGWVCQLCFQPVDPSVDGRQRWAASVDHIVPRSMGGTEDPDNLQLAHRICNSRRSDEGAGFRRYKASRLGACNDT